MELLGRLSWPPYVNCLLQGLLNGKWLATVLVALMARIAMMTKKAEMAIMAIVEGN